GDMTSAAAIPSVTLNDDHTMPVIGLGVGELSDAETEAAVSAALEAGYRLIDTAAAYGNEAAVGRAIASSGVPREELFVTTKQAALRAVNTARDVVTEAYGPLGVGRLLDNPTIVSIAEAHGKTPAQVLIRWSIQLGNVVIPRSSSPERVKSNLEVFDFELTDD